MSTVLTIGETVKIYNGHAYGVTLSGFPDWDRPLMHFHPNEGNIPTKLSEVRCKVILTSDQMPGTEGAWCVVESTRSKVKYAIDLSNGKWLPYD